MVAALTPSDRGPPVVTVMRAAALRQRLDHSAATSELCVQACGLIIKHNRTMTIDKPGNADSHADSDKHPYATSADSHLQRNIGQPRFNLAES